VSDWSHALLTNTSSLSTAYVAIFDGSNHWNITSAFVTEALAADTQQSFTRNTFVNLNAQNFGAGKSIWMENTTGWTLLGSYAEVTAGGECVDLYTASAGAIQDVVFDLHCENNSARSTFLVTGPNANPTLHGLTYNDEYPEATAALFYEDAGISTVAARDLTVKVVNSQTANVPLWNTPSKWSVSTRGIYLPASGYYSAPNAISGLVCLGATCTMH